MAKESEDGQEKSEEPTAKKRADARKKGQIPRSRELNTVVMMITSAVALLLFGSGFMAGMAEILRVNLIIEPADYADPMSMIRRFKEAVGMGISTIVPIVAILIIAAIVGPTLLGGMTFSGETMKPKLSKLNPIKGLGRIFGPKGLMELIKSLLKFLLVGSFGVFLLWTWRAEFFGLGEEPLYQSMAHSGELLAWGFFWLSLSLILVAVVDVPFQLWDYTRNLKMTKQEVKDEMKQTDGRPEVKARIRQTQREMAMRRMMEAVPQADVIVTNPTHYAVALKYDPDNMGAPRLVAKGVDEVALKIRLVAKEHKIEIMEAPPLARALYYSTKIDAEIPAGLYFAVAQVIAYVFSLKAWRDQPGSAPPPDRPQDADLSVPAEYEKMSKRYRGSA